MKVDSIINALIGKKNIFRVSELRDWLTLNSSAYDELVDNWKCSECGGSRIHLPCICEQPQMQWLFLEIYDEISKVVQLHSFEEYAGKELDILFDEDNVSIDVLLLEEWVRYNEKIAFGKLARFHVNYLDYKENITESDNLLIYTNDLLRKNIYVFRKEFSDIIIFKSVFDDLYDWHIESVRKKVIATNLYPAAEIHKQLVGVVMSNNPEDFLPYLTQINVEVGHQSKIIFYNLFRAKIEQLHSDLYGRLFCEIQKIPAHKLDAQHILFYEEFEQNKLFKIEFLENWNTIKITVLS